MCSEWLMVELKNDAKKAEENTPGPGAEMGAIGNGAVSAAINISFHELVKHCTANPHTDCGKDCDLLSFSSAV